MGVALLVNVVDGDAKWVSHVLKGETAIRLQQLLVCMQTHFSDVVAVVGVDEVVLPKLSLNNN